MNFRRNKSCVVGRNGRISGSTVRDAAGFRLSGFSRRRYARRHAGSQWTKRVHAVFGRYLLGRVADDHQVLADGTRVTVLLFEQAHVVPKLFNETL